MTTTTDGKRFPPAEKSPPRPAYGKLRLVRRGPVVCFLAADEKDANFTELFQCELGREDVLSIRAAANPGSDESPPLEVRLLDLEVRRAAAPPAQKKAYAAEYFQSLKGEPENAASFGYRGLDGQTVVKFAPDGLRITLPPGHPEQRNGTGVTLLSPVVGDFEITIRFDLLKETAPADANFVTRLSLGVVADTPEKNEGFVSRRMDEKGVTQFTANVMLAKYAPGAGPRQRMLKTTAKAGRLRLVRSGPTLATLAAAGDDADFVFLKQYDFSTLPLKSICIMTSAGARKGSWTCA